MDYSTFVDVAQPGWRIPVFRRFSADFLTPVAAFLKLRSHHPFSFLLESVEKGEHQGRYSYAGTSPRLILRTHLNLLSTEPVRGFGFFQRLRERIFDRPVARVPGLPPFAGGGVGMLAYDMVHELEVLPPSPPDALQLPDALFGVFDSLVAFDHLKNEVLLITNVVIGERESFREAYDRAQRALDALQEVLNAPLSQPERFEAQLKNLNASPLAAEFQTMVSRAREYILAGDIFQVVLSRRFCTGYQGDPFVLYRALRTVNPSPYMFFLEAGAFQIIGASPESLIRVEGREAEIVPIAGTRPRGITPEQDEELARELVQDPKEQAEHVMLVDLARNDLGRVCSPGSVRVSDFQTVERYSHVMHLISRVRGQLAENKDAVDALCAAFPAGTVSGAPKIRAMELIHQMEPVKRSFYAGAVGYIGYQGNLDLCITIRSVLALRNRLVFQAGAGIVADSLPEKELEETNNKARALIRAMELANEGIHDFVYR